MITQYNDDFRECSERIFAFYLYSVMIMNNRVSVCMLEFALFYATCWYWLQISALSHGIRRGAAGWPLWRAGCHIRSVHIVVYRRGIARPRDVASRRPRAPALSPARRPAMHCFDHRFIFLNGNTAIYLAVHLTTMLSLLFTMQSNRFVTNSYNSPLFFRDATAPMTCTFCEL